ncbi:PD40 domain-containing protein [Haliea sp. AH-315-K21]|nr:PD40 domain-containing protein [Haliea sp. AH-315-K21]MBN4059885.1 PD40 domain-containing protein [bacterium AH-315-I11]
MSACPTQKINLRRSSIFLTLLALVQGCQLTDHLTSDSTFSIQPLNTLAWIDREGHEVPINIPARNYIYAQLSPDGKQVALNSRDESSDIWIFDLQLESLRRLTFDSSPNIAPLWAPDGRLAYTRVIDGTQEIILQVADRSEPAELLSILSNNAKYPTSFTADGQTLIYHTSTFGYDIWSVSLEEETNSAQQLLANPDYRETNGALSPDERWLAYESDESGQLEIYVSPFPDVYSAGVQISDGGGSRPRWHPDGSELFYIKQHESELTGALMAVSINDDPSFSHGTPELLFENNFIAPNAGRQVYDISADGQRFLMIQNDH